MTQPILHRRHFVIGAAGALAAGGSVGSALAQQGQGGAAGSSQAQAQKPLPGYADWKDRDAVIVHSTNTIETHRGEIGPGPITPADHLYVRNNLSPPAADVVEDRDAWEISIEGVKRPRSLTVGDLKRMGVANVPAVLQCSGNGRGFFEHKASGTRWMTGAAGCVVWTGVPVRDLMEAFGGPAEGARFMTGTGGETIPQGIDPKTVQVERSVPIEAAENAILAWQMNGDGVPLAHGGPLRLIVPGYYGVNHVKYLKRLAFTPEESQAAIQRTGYRVRPVGVGGAPDQPSMWQMKVKSWVTHPIEDARSGRILVYGVAFGGSGGIGKVEVSTDGGSNWHEARLLEPDLGPYAWRVFVYPAELGAGTHTIASRATDAQGTVQEEATEPNHRGYDYRGWRRLAVDVTVA